MEINAAIKKAIAKAIKKMQKGKISTKLGDDHQSLLLQMIIMSAVFM